jgi:hypothetical protein
VAGGCVDAYLIHLQAGGVALRLADLYLPILGHDEQARRELGVELEQEGSWREGWDVATTTHDTHDTQNNTRHEQEIKSK